MFYETCFLPNHEGSGITPESITDSPSIGGCERGSVHYLGIRQKPEHSELSNPAKREAIGNNFIEPPLRYGMMDVNANLRRT